MTVLLDFWDVQISYDSNKRIYSVVEGTCDGVSAGTVSLTVNKGICKGLTVAGDCMFGWNSYVSLMVSETFHDRTII